ncbi:MAG: indolepyruvate oxidoreductase subunit beta [Christensenellales bacterium]|jgi:indolepyruvate ferredoxin oxidoreductase beta subunit
MTKGILLVGVGGQGIILISKILATGLTEKGYDVKMSEIHGMSQRGGSVTTQIKYGSRVAAPNIGYEEADIIVSFEKIEAIRALPFLKKDGVLITDEFEIAPMSVLTGVSEYPHDILLSKAGIIPKLQVVKAAETAKKLGNIRAQNIVLLGSLVRMMKLDDVDWKSLIKRMVPPKSIELNLQAFEAGYQIEE